MGQGCWSMINTSVLPAVKAWNYILLFASRRLPRSSTTPNGRRHQTPCLWCLSRCSCWAGSSISPSGESGSAAYSVISSFLIMKDNHSFICWQGDSLHMGVSAGPLPALFRLLLLQCNVDCAAAASRLLGFSHHTDVLQVAVQQGSCLSHSSHVDTGQQQ